MEDLEESGLVERARRGDRPHRAPTRRMLKCPGPRSHGTSICDALLLSRALGTLAEARSASAVDETRKPPRTIARLLHSSPIERLDAAANLPCLARKSGKPRGEDRRSTQCLGSLARMGHTIIEVPAMAGDPNHPAAAGPATITAALHDTGCELPVHRVAVEASGGETVRASIELGTQVKELVRAIVASGNVPVVLAGSCDVAPAVLAGIQCPRVGVIWIDAHADFNTPQSSFSGFWPGMTLAVVVGDCGQHVWSALGSDPVAPERVLLVGVRSLTPEEEARRLRQSAIRVVPWQGGLPQGDVEAALEALRDEVELVYVHLDLDALDPTIGKGVVDQPVAGGLSSSQLAELLDTVRKRCTVVAATVATYTPDKDDGSTLAVAVASINRLIDRPRGSGA